MIAGEVESGESLVGLEEVEERLHIGDVVEVVVQLLLPHFLALRHVVDPDEIGAEGEERGVGEDER